MTYNEYNILPTTALQVINGLQIPEVLHSNILLLFIVFGFICPWLLNLCTHGTNQWHKKWTSTVSLTVISTVVINLDFYSQSSNILTENNVTYSLVITGMLPNMYYFEHTTRSTHFLCLVKE